MLAASSPSAGNGVSNSSAYSRVLVSRHDVFLLTVPVLRPGGHELLKAPVLGLPPKSSQGGAVADQLSLRVAFWADEGGASGVGPTLLHRLHHVREGDGGAIGAQEDAAPVELLRTVAAHDRCGQGSGVLVVDQVHGVAPPPLHLPSLQEERVRTPGGMVQAHQPHHAPAGIQGGRLRLQQAVVAVRRPLLRHGTVLVALGAVVYGEQARTACEQQRAGAVPQRGCCGHLRGIIL
mmetsp:Transcript_15724/g.47374  ORF Transcript_15724/g.47374 Transcript_15724/m.47374 type:complete len:235 (+) Transcript_15724:587-1291(+)